MKTIKVTDEIKQKLDEIRSKYGHDNYSGAIGHLIGNQLPEVTAQVTSEVTQPIRRLPSNETKLTPTGQEIKVSLPPKERYQYKPATPTNQLGTPIKVHEPDKEAIAGLQRSLARLKEVFV